MIYINTKTGAVIETDCVVSGGDWQPQKPKAKKKPAEDEQESEE